MSEKLRKIQEAGFKRSITFKPASVNETNRTIEYDLATDTAEVFEFYEGYGLVREVLSFDKSDLIELPNSCPLLNTHNAYSTSAQFGSLRDFTIERAKQDGQLTKLVATAYFVDSELPESKHAWSLHSQGHGTDISVRYQHLEYPKIFTSGTVKTGKRTYKATKDSPIALVEAFRVLEGSVCPIGADSNSKSRNEDTTILTKSEPGSICESEPKFIENSETGERNMTIEKTQAPAAVDTAAIEANARAEGAKLEAKRRSDVNAVCAIANFPADKARTLADDPEITQARALEIVQAWKLEEAKPVAQARTTDITIKEIGREATRTAAIQALALRADDRIKIDNQHELTNKFRSGGITTVSREILRANNIDCNGWNDKQVAAQVLQRATTTSDLSNVLMNVAHLQSMTDVNYAPVIYPLITEIVDVEDFDKAYQARIESGSLEQVDETGEYKIMTLSDEASYMQLKKYGGSLIISEAVLVNDQKLNSIFRELSRMNLKSQMMIEEAVINVLLNNKKFDGSALFSSTNKNIATSAATLTASVLDDMRQKLAAQKSEENKPLGLRPQYILSGAKHARTAAEICHSISATDNSNSGVFNYYQSLKAIESAFITGTEYFLLADWRLEPGLQVGLLNKNSAPVVKIGSVAGKDGLVVDVTMRFGASAAGHKAIVKNAGS